MLVNLKAIQVDGGTQTRAEINNGALADYQEAMTSGATFPPIVVFYDGADHWLADGFHRVKAAGELDILSIEADVRQGTRRDAVLFSVGANTSHGLRRTNEDKRRAVTTLLQDEEWVKWSDREIARRCGVGAPLVGDMRPTVIRLQSAVRHGADGRTIDTSNIGRKRAPEPAPEYNWPNAADEDEVPNWAGGGDERARELARCEAAITEAIEPIARALSEIRDRQLYRESHPGDFVRFCFDEFGLGAEDLALLGFNRRGDQLYDPATMRAARILQVHPAKVMEAGLIMRNGIPELENAVWRGQLDLHTAGTIASLSLSAQPAALLAALAMPTAMAGGEP